MTMEYTHTLNSVATLANGASPLGDWDDVSAVWVAVRPYLRTRANDIHLPLSFGFAELLLDHHPEADSLVTRLAILLHDTGWARVDKDLILSEGFRSDNFMTSDVRVLHEIEGCNIAREVLPPLGYSETVVEAVCAIIDGHDTNPEHDGIEDAIMRDADRLWRFQPTGMAFSALWFDKTPQEIRLRLEDTIYPQLITDEARAIAEVELARTIELLKLDVIQ